ncbi:hypothetical protein Q2941_20235 [Bradyrhizobium sp. UFLA05-153]
MMQANSKTTTRRQFATWLAAATAGAGAAAVAVPVTTLAASPDDDSALLRLEEEIFEAWRAWQVSCANGEIPRLQDIRHADYERRLQEEKTAGRYLSADARWEAVMSTPDGLELERLIALSEDHFDRMAGLIDRMWSIPARTEAGRKSKVLVALVCIMDWRDRDEETDWRNLMARQLLIDLVGGPSAESMRDQFA